MTPGIRKNAVATPGKNSAGKHGSALFLECGDLTKTAKNHILTVISSEFTSLHDE